MYTKDEVICLADYIIKTDATIRAAAAFFGYSKSTAFTMLHSDMLPVHMQAPLQAVLQQHIKVRHLRGGDVIRKRFEEKNRMLHARKRGTLTEEVITDGS